MEKEVSDTRKEFDEWLYKVCEQKAQGRRIDLTEIYSSIDLTDAKLAFMDGYEPGEYADQL